MIAVSQVARSIGVPSSNPGKALAGATVTGFLFYLLRNSTKRTFLSLWEGLQIYDSNLTITPR